MSLGRSWGVGGGLAEKGSSEVFLKKLQIWEQFDSLNYMKEKQQAY